jgi:hypothetical protein
MISNVFSAAAVVAKVIAVALLPGSIPAVAYAVTTGDYSLISSLWNSIFGTPVDLKTDKEINGLTLTEVQESVWPSENDVETDFTSTTDAEATGSGGNSGKPVVVTQNWGETDLGGDTGWA